MNAKDEKPKYELQIDLNVLDHLGINLYSNVPAVLTEMVANAWDADASVVDIDINVDDDEITVTDNGNGMTEAEINQKFLTVGYRRRGHEGKEGLTPGNRPAMGRKGVGKLAPFSIAETVEVYSVKDGQQNGLRMSLDEIRKAQGPGGSKKYYPEVCSDPSKMPAKGTRIVLRKLKKHRVRKPNLMNRLARRFSVIGSPGFSVKVGGHEVTAKHRGDLDQLQYLWSIGEWSKPAWCAPKRESALPPRLEGWDDEWSIKGWIGTSEKPKDLVSASGNLNGIVVIARGRLFQENMIADFNDGRHYTKYLTGQIEADFLDDGPDDMATSDRQRLIEDDERYVQLMTYIKSVLSKLEAEWSRWRSEDDPKKVKEEFPQIREWIDAMDDVSHRKHASKLVGAVERMELDGAEKQELLKHAIYGFERLKLRGLTDELAAALEKGESEIVRLFSDQESLESTVYRDIAKGRIDAIKVLKNAVSRNDKEAVLQKILFNRLWLLDPSWERAKGTEEIEQQFKSIFPKCKTDDEATDDSKGRFDITYRTVPGKHVIVELKRASRKVELLELAEQGNKYVDELKRLLLKHGEATDKQHVDVEVIFVLGDPLLEQSTNPERYKRQMDAISTGSRVVTYDQLTTNALRSYEEYLEKTKALGKLAELVDSIGKPSGTAAQAAPAIDSTPEDADGDQEPAKS
jgi:hypothetical protein